MIIVTIVITSWSVYALCKYSFGVTDTVLGLPINPATTTTTTSATTKAEQLNHEQASSTQPPANNDTKSGVSAAQATSPPIRDQSKPPATTNYQPQTFAGASSASSSSPEHAEPKQQLIYSQPDRAFNWNQLLQDLSNDRDNDAIKNIDLNSVRPYEQLRSFQANAQYMRPKQARYSDYELEDDYNQLGYKLPSRSLESSMIEPLQPPIERKQRKRRYRTAETNPQQYSRSRNRRPHQRKTYYLPGRSGKARELIANDVVPLSDREEEPRNLEASLDDLEDLQVKQAEPADERDQREDENGEDRQAAESSRDEGESVVKHPPDEVDGDNSASSEDSQLDGPETTTESPLPSALEESDTSGSGGSEEDSDNNRHGAENSTPRGSPGSLPEPAERDNSKEDHSDEPDHTDEEAVKDTGKAIDEEVDRMTQPSLGVASRQERPFNYTNTVQFDDSVGHNADSISLRDAKRPSTPAATRHRPTGQGGDLKSAGHASGVAPASVVPSKTPNNIAATKVVVSGKTSATNDETDRRGGRKHRQKRSSRIETIRAPYEIDEFLDGLDFGSLTGEPSLARQRTSRVLINDLSAANSTNNPVMLGGANSTGLSHEPIVKEGSKRSEVLSSDRSSVSSPDYVGSDADYDDGSALDSEPARNRSTSTNDKKQKPTGNKLRYLKSNDTGLHELLKKKELLDVMRQGKLPAPYEESLGVAEPKQNRTSNNDHSTADSLFTVDHGLLLYPSSDEEHSHKEKSMSNKKKKHESKKGKKKSMIAIKKGGHKKKKHKKEEKKFHKEKKFKGAKKGKKMSKGKGGQGGKKGKKHYKDKGFKKKGFKNVYHKEEFGQKKSYFDEYRDKDFKKKWKKYDDKYNYAQMKKWQAKDVKKAKKMKDHGMKYKKYDKSRYKKKHQSHENKHSQSSSKKKKSKGMGF